MAGATSAPVEASLTIEPPVVAALGDPPLVMRLDQHPVGRNVVAPSGKTPTVDLLDLVPDVHDDYGSMYRETGYHDGAD
jgi:hypothetical protein